MKTTQAAFNATPLQKTIQWSTSSWQKSGCRPIQTIKPSNRIVLTICQSKSTTTDDNTSRRTLFTNLILLTNTLLAPLEAEALPGFKKELNNRRKIKVTEDQYKIGEQGLKYYDIVPGTGAAAKQGDRVAVHVDIKWRGITIFTSRQGMGVTGGSPIGFDVGAKPGAGGFAIKGVDLAVRGLRVGGQRRVLVPPELAYGSKGRGEVPPNATLEADIALLSIKKNAFGTAVKIIEG